MLPHFFGFLVHLVRQLGLPSMFALVMVENIGLPFPTEPAYVVGQSLIRNGSTSFLIVFLVLLAGHLSGALISYSVGRRIARGLHRRDLNEMQHRVAQWYDKYGSITVFLARLIGYIRPWSSYVAGIAEVPWAIFIVYTVLGSVIFNAITLLITNRLVFLWEHHHNLRILINFSFSLGFLFLIYEAAKNFGRTKSKNAG